MNPGQQFLHLLSDPNIAFLLFTIGFYGIIAELFHPNFFSGILGAIAIVVALIGSNALPLNVGGLLLILIGIGLLALEAVVASYGLLTVGGIVALVLGGFALWTGVDPASSSLRRERQPMDHRDRRRGRRHLRLGPGAGAACRCGAREASRTAGRSRSSGRPARPRRSSARRGSPMLAARPGRRAAAGARSRPGTALRVVGVDGLELIVEPAPAGDADWQD